jgi:hypothetical protein
LTDEFNVIVRENPEIFYWAKKKDDVLLVGVLVNRKEGAGLP